MKKKIPVYWMHCKACELLIENKLDEMPWVKLESISQNHNYIEVDVKSDKNIDEIKKAIEELWYHTQEKKVKKNDIFDYIIIFLIFIIFWILYLLFKDIKLFDDVLKNNNLSFFVILLIWLVASLSSCLAVTGWIVVWFSKYVDTSKKTSSHLKTQLNFHIWRIFWFAILGWILWSIWWFLGSFWLLNKILLLLAWVFMLYMWLNMLGFVKFKLSMPKAFWNKILSIKNPAFAPIIWALTFFLPCGFTQSMQVYAASSWSFMSWAMIMWTFALGTMPVLFLVWIGSSYFKDKDFNYVNKVIWVLVVYFGIFILSGFSNMFNLNIPVSNNSTQTQTNVNLEELKEVTITHNWSWFDDVILEWAKNYKLTILPESDWLGCMFWLTIPWIDNNEYPVKKWVPIVIDIKNPTPWKYKAVCTAMGMRHGNIIIK